MYANVAIFTHFYSYVNLVWSVYNVGTCCIFGIVLCTKETLFDFR